CFYQAEDGIRADLVTGVQTCALPIYRNQKRYSAWRRGDLGKLQRDQPKVERRHQGHVRQGRNEVISTSDYRHCDGDSKLNQTARSEERRVGKEWKGKWNPTKPCVTEA